jgi:hypothetical protein
LKRSVTVTEWSHDFCKTKLRFRKLKKYKKSRNIEINIGGVVVTGVIWTVMMPPGTGLLLKIKHMWHDRAEDGFAGGVCPWGGGPLLRLYTPF